MDIQKRFDRILGIYMQLQAKPLVKAQDLADRYGISLRTIYRDMQALQAAGVPIYGEAGVGYALLQGYKLPATNFTKEEALSFAAADKLMANYVDKDLYHHFSNALFKMKGGLRSSDKQQVADVEGKLLLNAKQGAFNQKVPAALSILMQSMAEGVRVAISYQKASSDVVESRVLEPIGLFHEYSFWYVMAYCLLRKDYRQFRLDRIQEIKLLHEERFGQQHEELGYYLQKKDEKISTQEVIIHVSKKCAPYLEWERKYHGFVSERELEHAIEMTFQCKEDNEWFARWLLMIGDEVTIVSPEFLRTRVRTLLKKQLARLDEEDALREALL